MMTNIKSKIWNTYNFTALKMGQLYFMINHLHSDISKYKNLHMNESCFIIGNGPSLEISDLSSIKDLGMLSFGSNKIYKIYPETAWRPTYYTITDDHFIRDREVQKSMENTVYDCIFTRSQYALILKNLNCKYALLDTQYSRTLIEQPQFSDDCSKIIYDIATVTYYSIQLAAYMGFKKIYLTGFDHRLYKKYADNHFYTTQTRQKSGGFEPHEMTLVYDFAERYSRKNDFRIYNATRGGALEVFERVNIEDVFREQRRINV